MLITYTAIVLIIIILCQISVTSKMLHKLLVAFCLVYILLGFLVINGVLTDEIRDLQYRLANHFDIELMDNSTRLYSLFVPNLDVNIFLAYIFSIMAFIVKLITQDEFQESLNIAPIKHNFAWLIIIPLSLFMAHSIFNKVGTLDDYNNMSGRGRGMIRTQFLAVFWSAAAIGLSAWYGVYIRWFVTNSRELLARGVRLALRK